MPFLVSDGIVGLQGTWEGVGDCWRGIGEPAQRIWGIALG